MKVLVLSGGGSHGAFQAGVLAYLAARGDTFDAIVGTSVGAINGAGFSALGGKSLPSMWFQLKKKKDVMRLKFPWPWTYDGIYHFRPLKKKLHSWLSGHSYTIPVYVATVDLHDLSVHYDVLTGDIEKDMPILLASSAVAPIQSPTNLKIDGGHKEIAPVRFAVEVLKATEVTVVLCDPPVEKRERNWKPAKFFPIISIGIRALTAMIDEILRTDIINCPHDVELRIFQPKEDLKVSALDYERAQIQRMLTLGYEGARDGYSYYKNRIT